MFLNRDKSVTGRQTGDGSWRIATTRHRLSVRGATCLQSSVVLYTYTTLCGVIILERGILMHFFRLFIWVVCGSSRAVIPFGNPLRIGLTFLDVRVHVFIVAITRTDIADCSTCSIPFSTQTFFVKENSAIYGIRTSETNGLICVGTCLLRLEVQNIYTTLAWQVSLLRNIPEGVLHPSGIHIRYSESTCITYLTLHVSFGQFKA